MSWGSKTYRKKKFQLNLKKDIFEDCSNICLLGLRMYKRSVLSTKLMNFQIWITLIYCCRCSPIFTLFIGYYNLCYQKRSSPIVVVVQYSLGTPASTTSVMKEVHQLLSLYSIIHMAHRLLQPLLPKTVDSCLCSAIFAWTTG